MAIRKIESETDRNFKLVGIGTTLRDYKLCHYLSEALESEFVKINSCEFETKDRSAKIAFSVFKTEWSIAKTLLLLFSNKNKGEILLPEASNFDFLLKITDNTASLKTLISEIKKIPEVIAAAEIPPKSIKHPERMQYEEIIEKQEFPILKIRRNP